MGEFEKEVLKMQSLRNGSLMNETPSNDSKEPAISVFDEENCNNSFVKTTTTRKKINFGPCIPSIKRSNNSNPLNNAMESRKVMARKKGLFDEPRCVTSEFNNPVDVDNPLGISGVKICKQFNNDPPKTNHKNHPGKK